MATASGRSDSLKIRWSKRNLFSKIIIIILALMVLSAIFGEKPPTTTVSDQSTGSVAVGEPSQEDVIEEPVKEVLLEVWSYILYKEYSDNEIAADEKYKWKVFIVKWPIDNIGKDLLDNPYISLKADKYFWSIQCMLSDGEISKASKLKNWQTVSLKWEWRWKLWTILMRECTIL